MVRSRMLCQDVSPPPPGLDTTFVPSPTPESTRDHFIKRHENGTCAGCHKMMDWIGFAFESYDGWGRHRTTDNGFAVDAGGRHLWRPTGQDVTRQWYLRRREPVRVPGRREAATRCMERYWTYYAYGSSSWAQDACTYDAVYNEAKTNSFGLESMLMAILHAPTFTTRVQGQIRRRPVMPSRRQFVGSVGAGLLLAPFVNVGLRRQAQAATTKSKRLLMFGTMGTYPPLWTPKVISGRASPPGAP